MLDDTVTPRFTIGDKDGLDAQLKAGAEQQAEASRIAIGASEGELIVHLEEPREPQSPPRLQKGLYNGPILLPADAFEGHGIGEGIHDMKTVEPDAAMKISRTDQIELMKDVALCGADGRIRSSSVLIASLRGEIVASKDPIDRPRVGDTRGSKPLKFPLDRDGSPLSILVRLELPTDFADELLDRQRRLAGSSVGSTRTGG